MNGPSSNYHQQSKNACYLNGLIDHPRYISPRRCKIHSVCGTAVVPLREWVWNRNSKWVALGNTAYLINMADCIDQPLAGCSALTAPKSNTHLMFFLEFYDAIKTETVDHWVSIQSQLNSEAQAPHQDIIRSKRKKGNQIKITIVCGRFKQISPASSSQKTTVTVLKMLP